MGGNPCAVCREPIPTRPGPGRPRVYCGSRCRRLAERRAAAARAWALADPALKVMVATDLEVVDLAAAAIPGFEVVTLDVDQVNRELG